MLISLTKKLKTKGFIPVHHTCYVCRGFLPPATHYEYETHIVLKRLHACADTCSVSTGVANDTFWLLLYTHKRYSRRRAHQCFRYLSPSLYPENHSRYSELLYLYMYGDHCSAPLRAAAP